MKEPIYQSVFGISVGDIVRTSYNSGPFVVVAITAPRYTSKFPGTIVIRTWQVIDLVCRLPNDLKKRRGPFYLNSIRREGDRYFSDQNDEVFVEKHGAGPTQMSMFSPSGESPYPFDPEVDYTLDGKVWKCDKCGDFNGEPASRWQRAYCPKCGRYSDWELILMPPRKDGQKNWSDCQVSLGYRT